MQTDFILCDEKKGVDGTLGIITLNRPEVLNSLNLAMIQKLHEQLKTWAQKPHIQAVLIQAAPGRAFCAGGDLRPLYENMMAGASDLNDFFREEYALNRYIFHYPKPYIALLDGLTMGGGVGISIHGSHRIGTENLSFAMPETGIGLFPDVGGTYFLPRLPHHLGFYLGLTGARLSSHDCFALQITQFHIPSEKRTALIEALTSHPFGHHPHHAVSAIIQPFCVPASPSSVILNSPLLEHAFQKETIEEIFSAVDETTHQLLQKKSPTSLKVTLKALQQGQHLDFDHCMQQEFRLVSRFLDSHDFREGIRAAIIEKDQMPIWKPNKINAVSNQEVDHYFSPLSFELAI